MNKKAFLVCFCAILASYVFLPSELCAETGEIINAKSAAQLKSMTTGIQDLIFGIPANLMCTFGAGMGIYQMFAQNSITPLLTWGGIACLIKFIPIFLNSIFP